MQDNRNFYNNLAKKNRGFKKFPSHDEFPNNENPEVTFEKLVKKYGGKEKTGLDIGCGDGIKTIEFAPYYQKIFGIDNSKEMFKLAKTEHARDNIEYIFAEKNNLPINSNSIDVAWSRRGPTLSNEIRVLEPKSVYIQIKIAHRDLRELKQIFGRGQNIDKINYDDLQELIDLYKRNGFKIILAKRYKYLSFCSEKVFLDFLQNTPVFVDFDLEKDKKFYQEYIKKFTTPKGIKLEREKMILVAERTSK